MLGVDPLQRLPIDALRGMARGLARPEVAAESEDREQIALGGIFELRIRSRGRSEMAGIRPAGAFEQNVAFMRPSQAAQDPIEHDRLPLPGAANQPS